MADLIPGGESQDNGTSPGLKVSLHPVHYLFPTADDAGHRLRNRLVRFVVVLREKGVPLFRGLFSAGGKREVKSWFDCFGSAPCLNGILAYLIQANTINLRACDVVEPAVSHPADSPQTRFDIVGSQPDGHTPRLNRLRLQGDMLKTGERTGVRDIIFAPQSPHHLNQFFAPLDAFAG